LEYGSSALGFGLKPRPCAQGPSGSGMLPFQEPPVCRDGTFVIEIDELADSVLVAALGVWTVGAAADDGYQVNQAGYGVAP
jgi:hypothetical protein